MAAARLFAGGARVVRRSAPRCAAVPAGPAGSSDDATTTGARGCVRSRVPTDSSAGSAGGVSGPPVSSRRRLHRRVSNAVNVTGVLVQVHDGARSPDCPRRHVVRVAASGDTNGGCTARQQKSKPKPAHRQTTVDHWSGLLAQFVVGDCHRFSTFPLTLQGVFTTVTRRNFPFL